MYLYFVSCRERRTGRGGESEERIEHSEAILLCFETVIYEKKDITIFILYYLSAIILLNQLFGKSRFL